jgi:hypothetical protein
MQLISLMRIVSKHWEQHFGSGMEYRPAENTDLLELISVPVVPEAYFLRLSYTQHGFHGMISGQDRAWIYEILSALGQPAMRAVCSIAAGTSQSGFDDSVFAGVLALNVHEPDLPISVGAGFCMRGDVNSVVWEVFASDALAEFANAFPKENSLESLPRKNAGGGDPAVACFAMTGGIGRLAGSSTAVEQPGGSDYDGIHALMLFAGEAQQHRDRGALMSRRGRSVNRQFHKTWKHYSYIPSMTRTVYPERATSWRDHADEFNELVGVWHLGLQELSRTGFRRQCSGTDQFSLTSINDVLSMTRSNTHE